MSSHSFDPEIATKVGLNAAVIFQNIRFWVQKNAANGRHFHEGKHWTYNSVKAFETLFPYLTPSQIRTALKRLVEADLIAEGNHNPSAYDRTKWYCVCDEIHLRNLPNGFAKKRKPIPDNKPDNKPVITPPTPPKPETRATQMPKEWRDDPPSILSDKNFNYALSKGLTPQEATDETFAFRDWAEAHGRTYKNWDAAWRTRCNHWQRFSGTSRTRQDAAAASQLRIIARAAESDELPDLGRGSG